MQWGRKCDCRRNCNNGQQQQKNKKGNAKSGKQGFRFCGKCFRIYVSRSAAIFCFCVHNQKQSRQANKNIKTKKPFRKERFNFLQFKRLSLIIRAENILNLMLNNLLNKVSCRSKVLAGVKLSRILRKVLSESCSHCNSDV